MKTTFDLPDPLLRRAKAVAASQGRPLRDLVAQALDEKLDALAQSERAVRSHATEWEAFEARLVKLPDGSYLNPEATDDDDSFAEILETIRKERMTQPWHNPFEDHDAFAEVPAAPSLPGKA